MDASSLGRLDAQWPVGEVVLPLGLDPRNIGLFGSVPTGEGSIYVPLRLSASAPDPSRARAPPMIVFRSLVDLDSFQWRLYEPGGAVPTWNRYEPVVRAGDPITLTLDAPVGRVVTARRVADDSFAARLSGEVLDLAGDVPAQYVEIGPGPAVRGLKRL